MCIRDREHTVQAELKRQQASAEAKKQKKAAKLAKKEQKKAALEHFNSLSEENRQNIRAANKRRKEEKKNLIKDKGIKWYEFQKKKEARLEYDIAPVSYTHLDVYKRQVYVSGAGPAAGCSRRGAVLSPRPLPLWRR